MLRPLVRGVGQGTAFQRRSHSFARRIHTTPICTADDDPVRPQPPTEPESVSSERARSTANDSRAVDDAYRNSSLTNWVRDIHESTENDDLPERQREREPSGEHQDRRRRHYMDPSVSNPPDFTDGAPPDKRSPSSDPNVRGLNFRGRQHERFAKLRKTTLKFQIPNTTPEERRAAYNQSVHDEKEKDHHEANLRGKEVFDMINKRRAERGEQPLGYLREPHSEGTPHRRGEGRDGDRRPPRGSRPSAGRRRKAEDDEPQHRYLPSFNPSEAEMRGLDEVDIELAYELPDPEETPNSDDKAYFILSRDGTVNENRKTNRDWDVVADDDIAMFIDQSELGAVGPSFYHEMLYPQPGKGNEREKDKKDARNGKKVITEDGKEQFDEASKEFVQEMGSELEPEQEQTEEAEMEGAKGGTAKGRKTMPKEHEETDLQELWDIKTEIETEGLLPELRTALRRDRKEKKSRRERREQQRLIAGYEGNWEKRVPLPQKHKPETANLLDYIPPTLTHESFQYGIPAIPYGTQGRIRAVHSVSLAEAELMIPSETAFENLSLTPEEAQDFENSRDELASILDNIEIPDEKPGKSILFGKLPTVKKVPFRGNRPKEKFQEHEIENIYSEDQLAIWREMNKGSFAPKGFKYPDDYPDDTDNIVVNDAQQQRDDQARLASVDIMEQLDLATLRRFRRRDEWEIRDIRRRLGLPYEEPTEFDKSDSEWYTKTRLDRIIPLNVTKLASFDESQHKKEDAAKESQATEVESVVQGSTGHTAETGTGVQTRQNASEQSPLFHEPKEKIHKAEIEDPNQEKGKTDPLDEYLPFWRDAKAYLETLSPRIHHLRRITQETRDRIRRHGTAEMILPKSSSSSDKQIESSPTVIMDKLREQFLIVHNTLEKLEIIVTSILQGDKGPVDKAFSQDWVEYHVHQEEAKEFEKTAVRMGYAPNSVSMDPVMTEELTMQWERMTAQMFQYKTQVGLEGEYRDMGDNMEDMPEPLRKAANYASAAGLDLRQKWLKVGMLGHTLKEFGLLPDGRTLMEEKPEGVVAADADKPVVEEGKEDEKEVEERMEDGEDEGDDKEEWEADVMNPGPPVAAPPGDPLPVDYSKVMEQMRKSMTDLDKEVSSLEESYDSFLATHPLPAEQITPPTTPSQEASP